MRVAEKLDWKGLMPTAVVFTDPNPEWSTDHPCLGG
jgi:hypothetical protein